MTSMLFAMAQPMLMTISSVMPAIRTGLRPSASASSPIGTSARLMPSM